MTSVQTTNMTKTIDLAAIMATYTQQHNAMMARSAANRKAFAEGRAFPFPAPECQSGNWNISDRH
jgi:hypothetical protein